mgnify:CR=1 FL=1
MWLMIAVFSGCNQTKQTESIEGNWAFSLPDGNPAWLSIKKDSTAQMLWSVGSAKSIDVQSFSEDQIELAGKFGWRPYGNQKWYNLQNPIVGELNNDGNLILTVVHKSENETDTFKLTGKHMPPMPPKPDLSQVRLEEPLDILANGMQGWKLTNPDKTNGWRIEDGVLINETPKKDFGAYGNYGNLRTLDDFEDFELTIDYNVPEEGNSGIYLRGTYEVQVVDKDSPMQGIQGPGAIFGRIKPTHNNANPGGEWNRYKITLIDRHVTVELNGETVIDNQPLEGCTGGGINADDTKPGPVFLQGDHTSVKYKNIFIREVQSD